MFCFRRENLPLGFVHVVFFVIFAFDFLIAPFVFIDTVTCALGAVLHEMVTECARNQNSKQGNKQKNKKQRTQNKSKTWKGEKKKNNNKKPSKKRMGLSSKEGGSAKTFTEIKYRYMVRNIYQDR